MKPWGNGTDKVSTEIIVARLHGELKEKCLIGTGFPRDCSHRSSTELGRRALFNNLEEREG